MLYIYKMLNLVGTVEFVLFNTSSARNSNTVLKHE
jgi:hypothetical protein